MPKPAGTTAGISPWLTGTAGGFRRALLIRARVTVPNQLWDADKSRGLYQQYIDQFAYAWMSLGFDGMVLNEHHQNIYGPDAVAHPIAAALTQKTMRGKIVILGKISLPL
jgi:hypothetical protein